MTNYGLVILTSVALLGVSVALFFASVALFFASVALDGGLFSDNRKSEYAMGFAALFMVFALFFGAAGVGMRAHAHAEAKDRATRTCLPYSTTIITRVGGGLVPGYFIYTCADKPSIIRRMGYR